MMKLIHEGETAECLKVIATLFFALQNQSTNVLNTIKLKMTVGPYEKCKKKEADVTQPSCARKNTHQIFLK